MQSKNLYIGGVGAGKDLVQGACTSIIGVLSRPTNHALQAILYKVLFELLKLPSLFFSFLDFSWLHRFYWSTGFIEAFTKSCFSHPEVQSGWETLPKRSIITTSSLLSQSNVQDAPP